jgi:hypothetical protein
MDERAYVAFLRDALGDAAAARPRISLDHSFTAAATAAGLIKPGEIFDAFANDRNFLFAAFLFEDVGVTAFKGAAPFISNKTYLDAAAGLLATEAYHAGIVRATLFSEGLVDDSVFDVVHKISAVRNAVTGPPTMIRTSAPRTRPTSFPPTNTAGHLAGPQRRSSTSSTSTPKREPPAASTRMGSMETSFTAPGRPRTKCVPSSINSADEKAHRVSDAAADDRQPESPGRVQSDTPFEGSMPCPELRDLRLRTATALTQAT